VQRIRLGTIVAIADNASPAKPFGIWEMGNSTGTTSPPQTQVEAYVGYLQSVIAGRLQAGKANAEIAWYNGNGVNTIGSSSDYLGAPLRQPRHRHQLYHRQARWACRALTGTAVPHLPACEQHRPGQTRPATWPSAAPVPDE